ncbi:MAG TPA: sugar ABC transporter ATP-binding protein [Pirellulales bacterium]|nr:sugar ABC transporter ATP-binding protein [Pirellulales bacterium]
MAAPLLEMLGIRKRFGATHALREVSLTARAGEVLALIGENGAGKSTLMKILSGVYQPDGGAIQLAGRPYAPQGPAAARRAGVAMIYQELNLAPDLSIEDNILLGQERSRFGLVKRSEQRTIARAALAQLGHAALSLDLLVGRLSVGLQQVVEIARALVQQARVVVFDEPTSSLARHDVEHLFEVIRKLKGAGLAVIYISHFLEEIRAIGDRYTVLRDGESVGSGNVASATEAQIVSLMVGRQIAELFPQVAHQPGAPILTAEQLSGAPIPEHVSFSLRRGEILGIAGLVGAGRTELLRTLFGLNATRHGGVLVEQLRPRPTPRARIRAGLGFVSEDRKGEGLAQIRSIEDNATLSRLAPYSRAGWLNLRRRRQAVRGWLARLQVKARGPEQPIHELSGGNQQKIALARVLHQEAQVLLLDEPTRGIDVGTKAEIYRLIGQLAADGKAIIFVSSYLPELLAVCDRIGVMARGRLRAIRPAGEWSEETIMALAVSDDEAAA